MPFIGVLPERISLFQPQPRRAVAVNDAAAWRLNPAYRQVYNKLDLALAARLTAAPCGVAPGEFGIAAQSPLFVKPIINLFGTALGAQKVSSAEVPPTPGSFWCECLNGEHSSSDCLVENGEPRWFAHTLASTEKDAERPLYWSIGVARPDLEPILTTIIHRHLAGYTGLCNIELIGGQPIELHLRGSNGFFDFYGTEFLPSWVALVDGEPFTPPPPIPGGYVLSLFGHGTLKKEFVAQNIPQGVKVQIDQHTPGRIAILRCTELEAGRQVLSWLVRHIDTV